MAADLCDLQVHINGQQTFYIHEKTITRFSGKLRKLIKKEKKRTQIRKTGIEIHDFPGGSDGFELFSRFCYNNGEIDITVSNVSLLHCCAVFLSMNDTLVPKTTDLYNRISDWSFKDVRDCLKSCTPIFTYADSFGIIDKLISNLILKITQHSDSNISLLIPSSSSSSSPDSTVKSGGTLLRLSSSSSSKGLWWYDDMTILPPFVIERGLFWVLRIVSGFGLSRECRGGLERLIGGMLDQAKVDDLLVSNSGSSGVYDVNLVLRLIRESNKVEGVCLERMKKVGGLLDKYLGEIAPDQSLKISKFLGVAESLPDCARDCFDGVYKAIDIYLESHPCLSLEERSRLCRCLNYEKLSLEACKDLAKNPRIPPRIAVQALVSQHSNIPTVYTNDHHQDYSYVINDHNHQTPLTKSSRELMVLYNNNGAHDHLQYDSADHSSRTSSRYDQADKELDDGVVKLNLQKMQWRVVELEKVCREMKGQMSKMVKGDRVMLSGSSHGRPLPRLC
ncbi:putative BTB/POZ domain, NPH3 domain, NPH3/RPT2-like family protein [Helianthus annuus]|nr:putative BTB/POZ domain, NPH3 domain, NPH3/RPT2-like family protein [Helianthus annuus]